MIRNISKASLRRGTLCALFTCALVFPALVRAASINYGTFVAPPGVAFIDVTEASGTDPVPQYGPPAPFATGLDFDPTFTSSAAGGSADISDGQLNFTIMGMGNKGIASFTVGEAGDYTIIGAGGAGTSVNAGLAVRATIVGVNNAPVAPIAVTPLFANFSDSLPGAAVAAPWSLGGVIDVGAALGPGKVATKIEVVINNVLATTSEAGSAAFIAKKDFVIDTTTIDIVPEPASFALAGLALAGLGLVARVRS